MDNLKYYEILSRKKELRKSINSPALRFKVIGNIITNQLSDIAEYYLLSKGVNIVFEAGNFDNIVQDILSVDDDTTGVILFWEAGNIVNQLHSKISNFSDNEYYQIVNKVKSEIDLVVEKLAKIPVVIFNKFSATLFNVNFLKKNKLDLLCDELNNYIEEKLPQTVFIADIDKIISQISVEKAFNSRDYISSRVLYTVDFFKAYTKFISPVILSAVGKTKKALIFDCDNTLWKGVLGEDGFEGIKMSENDKVGKPYAEVQNMALELSKNGVIIGLCSKNNPEDVENVLENHQDMILKNENITIKKVNWTNKAQNLKEIATDLNIGVDSLVFVDDSDFEINLIKEQIPEVTTIQVPRKIHLYPDEIKKAYSFFFKNIITEEDLNKTKMYADQVKRKDAENNSADFEDYLRSLEMKLTIFVNDKSKVARMAQMTQKTNQFNLTTKRYTEAQILNFTESPEYDVFALNVADKFGDNGITGLAIVKKSDKYAEIDTFLMSCRIIGRNIEYKFIDLIINKLQQEKIIARYIETKKNAQTKVFYENAGFVRIQNSKSNIEFELHKNNRKQHNFEYIQITQI